MYKRDKTNTCKCTQILTQMTTKTSKPVTFATTRLIKKKQKCISERSRDNRHGESTDNKGTVWLTTGLDRISMFVREGSSAPTVV